VVVATKEKEEARQFEFVKLIFSTITSNPFYRFEC
jgi:hypothetical protein